MTATARPSDLLQFRIAHLQADLAEKDAEIEKLRALVEVLLTAPALVDRDSVLVRCTRLMKPSIAWVIQPCPACEVLWRADS